MLGGTLEQAEDKKCRLPFSLLVLALPFVYRAVVYTTFGSVFQQVLDVSRFFLACALALPTATVLFRSTHPLLASSALHFLKEQYGTRQRHVLVLGSLLDTVRCKKTRQAMVCALVSCIETPIVQHFSVRTCFLYPGSHCIYHHHHYKLTPI